MKHLLPMADSNMFIASFEIFCSTDSTISRFIAYAFTNFRSCDKIMNNISREHTILLKMLENRHYYIGLEVYCFKDCIKIWTGSIHEYYILFLSSPHEMLKTFQTKAPLQTVYNSDDNNAVFNNNQPELNSQLDIVQNIFTMMAYYTTLKTSVLSRKCIPF